MRSECKEFWENVENRRTRRDFWWSKRFVGEENAVTEAPRVLTVGRGKVRASETRSNERKGLKGEEFYEESNVSPKHGLEAWENPGNTWERLNKRLGGPGNA